LIEVLHDSEINGEIGWFYDGVWRANLGDPWNGYRAEKDGFLSLGQAAGGSATKRSTITPIANSPKNTCGRIPAINRNTRQSLAEGDPWPGMSAYLLAICLLASRGA